MIFTQISSFSFKIKVIFLITRYTKNLQIFRTLKKQKPTFTRLIYGKIPYDNL